MTTYYVATTGSDSTGDGSIGTPWLTIQHAHDQGIYGDVISVAAGTYNERLYIDTPGLTFEAQVPATKPIIWYEATADYQKVVRILVECVFDGFKVHGGLSDTAVAPYIDQAIEAGGSSGVDNYGHITIKNCECYNVGAAGVKVHYQHGLLVEDCDVHDTALTLYGGGSPPWAGGNSFTRGSGYVVRNNRVWDVWGEGIPFDFGVVDIQCYGNIVGRTWSGKIYLGEVKDAYVHGNLVFNPAGHSAYNNGPDSGLGLTDESYTPNKIDIDNVHFYNNIAVDCSAGIWIAHGEDELNTKNAYFYNNTIVVLRSGNLGVGAYGAAFQNVSVTNNIFYISAVATAADGYLTSAISYDRNIWTKPPPGVASGTNDIIEDPLLVDPEAVIATGDTDDIDATDYKIQALSPAIDYGDTQVPVDYFGNSRAGIVDVGAHEYDGTVPPSDTDTATDWGADGLDGLHYETEIIQNEYGRKFNGIDAFVDLNDTGSSFDPDNGAIIVRVKPTSSGYADNLAHHFYEAYAWNDTTGKNSTFVIKQSVASNRIDFSAMVEGSTDKDFVTIPYVTNSTEWMTLSMTWDSAGSIVAYVDGVAVGSVDYPTAWLASSFYFIRVGSGGGQYYVNAQIAHAITVYGETPSAADILAISEDLENNITNTAALDLLWTDYAWHNLRDKSDETEPEAFTCAFTADDTAPETDQLVTFDLTSSVIPASGTVDRVELIPYIGATAVIENGPTMPTDIEYTYLAVGTEDVIITIFLTNGESQRLIKREYIEVSAPWVTFTCDFVADDVDFEVDQLVTFDLTSSVIPGGYSIDYVKLYPGFGQLGDTVTINGPSMPTEITYTYTIPGLYTVRIDIHLVGEDLFARETKDDYIIALAATPAPAIPPTADYTELLELLAMIEANVVILEAAV